jgi:hypothetical protein
MVCRNRRLSIARRSARRLAINSATCIASSCRSYARHRSCHFQRPAQRATFCFEQLKIRATAVYDRAARRSLNRANASYALALSPGSFSQGAGAGCLGFRSMASLVGLRPTDLSFGAIRQRFRPYTITTTTHSGTGYATKVSPNPSRRKCKAATNLRHNGALAGTAVRFQQWAGTNSSGIDCVIIMRYEPQPVHRVAVGLAIENAITLLNDCLADGLR